MFECQFEDIVEFLGGKFLKEQGNHKTVDKPNLGAIFQSIPKSLKQGEYLFLHILSFILKMI